MIGIFWFWWGCEEILRELVIDGCSRGGERRLCIRRMYSWIVDLNNYFTASTV